MTVDARMSADGRTLTVRVPMTFQRRGGRKLVVAPDGSIAPAKPRAQTVSALVKVVVNAHRWQKMLDSGEYATVAELAAAERVNPSNASRVLRLTLISPDIVDAILDGRHARTLTLEMLLRPFPSEWYAQRLAFPPAL